MLDRSEQQVVDDIGAYGWHVICVAADDEGPGFDYTVGLTQTFNHPEVIILGLDVKVMHQILTNMVDDIRRGGTFREAKEYGGLLENYVCAVRPVHSHWHTEYLGYAMWYCRHKGAMGSLEAVQCIWPDKAGRFPWDPNCNDAVRKLQPLLYLESEP